jgi:hypothetical protein
LQRDRRQEALLRSRRTRLELITSQPEHAGGFSVDASVRIGANDRAALERLLRYCARPFALERLEAIDEHRLIYRLTKPQQTAKDVACGDQKRRSKFSA